MPHQVGPRPLVRTQLSVKRAPARFSGGAGRKTRIVATPVFDGWTVLLKMGRRGHLDQFRKRGLLYMNSSRYFAEKELRGDGLRWDRFEGTDRIIQPWDLKHMTITQPDRPPLVVPGSQFAGPILISFGREDAWNVFCLFALRYPFPSPLIDQRNFAFGNSFVVILNTMEFLKRAQTAAAKIGYGWRYGPVEYRDYETHSGDTGPFCKPLIFAFQNEFRFAIRPGSNDPIRLWIGDLTDITTPVLRLAKIRTLVVIGSRPQLNKTRLLAFRRRRPLGKMRG